MAKIYVYCPRGSNGAYDLIKAVEGHRLRRFDGIDFWDKRRRVKIEPGATVVCWGSSVPELEGITVINSMEAPLNKFDETTKLIAAGVPTIEVVKPNYGTPHSAYLQAGYLARTYQHQGGLDLLNGIPRADFYVKKETFTKEVRIHSFSGRSIRAGEKVHRDGFRPVIDERDWRMNMNLVHPWIRSFDAGWRIKYDDFKSTMEQKAIAHAAVKALGLTFGAVDIAIDARGSLRVLEVNTAPGCDPNTTAAYVKAIQRVIKGATAEAVK